MALAGAGQFSPVRSRGECYVDPDWFTPLAARSTPPGCWRSTRRLTSTAHHQAPSAISIRIGKKRRWSMPTRRSPTSCSNPTLVTGSALTREFRERAVEAGYRETLGAAASLRALHAV